MKKKLGGGMKKIFFRFCEKCGNRFQPNGRHQKLCNSCQKEVRNVNFIKMIHRNDNIKLNDIKKLL
jgi:uncharacterized OB-fold protein